MRLVHDGARAGVRCGACRSHARRHPAARVERPLPHLSVRQLPRINPAFRALPTRDAAFPCKLQVSGAKREEVRPSDRQVKMASGRALSACNLGNFLRTLATPEPIKRPLPHLSVRQLPRINPAFRALPTRDAAFPCKLQVSGAKREEVRPSDRQVKMASGRALSACNLGNFLRTLATPEPIKIPWGGG